MLCRDLLQNKYYALSAASALFKYLESRGRTFGARSLKIRYLPLEGTMLIDSETAKNLELVENVSLLLVSSCLVFLSFHFSMLRSDHADDSEMYSCSTRGVDILYMDSSIIVTRLWQQDWLVFFLAIPSVGRRLADTFYSSEATSYPLPQMPSSSKRV